jgi:MATE family multidrug resistance protein
MAKFVKRPCFQKNWFLTEALKIFKLTWPTALGYLFQQLILFVSLTFCGHIGNSAIILDAVALAQSIVTITGVTFVYGFGSALDTLASQAWGAKNYKKVGVYLQRSILIHMLITAFILAIWFNVETILNLLQQPPEVVKLTLQYIQLLSAGLPAIILYVLLLKYFQAQNIVYPLIPPGIFANIANAVFHYLFLFVAKWGIRGAAGAVVIAEYTFLLSLLIIIYVRKLHVKTWGGWSRDSLNGWGQFALFGIPGLLMFIVEMGSFEIGYYITGSIGKIQQSIHAVVSAYVYIVFMMPISLGTAVTIRVGNELGAGEPVKAKRAAFVGLVIDIVWVVFIVGLTVALKTYIPMIFTADVDVLQALGPIMYVVAALLVADNLQGYFGGILRGSGKQLVGALANFVSYWMIGVPLGGVLALVLHLGALGYWLGLLTGDFIQTFIYGVILLTIRWKKQAKKAQHMAQGGEDLPSPVTEKSPLIQAGDGLPWYDSNIWSKEEVDSSLVMTRSQNMEKSPHPVKVGCATVVVRILTCAVFVLVLIGGVTLSQLCIYRCELNISINHTNISNVTLIASLASNDTCQWDFLHPW